MSSFWEKEFTKSSNQICAVIFISVHGSWLLCDGMPSDATTYHRMIRPLDNYLQALRLLLAVDRLCK
jgi:hypothetical protein